MVNRPDTTIPDLVLKKFARYFQELNTLEKTLLGKSFNNSEKYLEIETETKELKHNVEELLDFYEESGHEIQGFAPALHGLYVSSDALYKIAKGLSSKASQSGKYKWFEHKRNFKHYKNSKRMLDVGMMIFKTHMETK